jgi:hypothetical protein
MVSGKRATRCGGVTEGPGRPIETDRLNLNESVDTEESVDSFHTFEMFSSAAGPMRLSVLSGI